jgi:hypothetical protein
LRRRPSGDSLNLGLADRLTPWGPLIPWGPLNHRGPPDPLGTA